MQVSDDKDEVVLFNHSEISPKDSDVFPTVWRQTCLGDVCPG